MYFGSINEVINSTTSDTQTISLSINISCRYNYTFKAYAINSEGVGVTDASILISCMRTEDVTEAINNNQQQQLEGRARN